MKELIKLLNQGWRVNHGFVVGEEKFVKLTHKPLIDPENGETLIPVAWVVEDGTGKVEIYRK